MTTVPTNIPFLPLVMPEIMSSLDAASQANLLQALYNDTFRAVIRKHIQVFEQRMLSLSPAEPNIAEKYAHLQALRSTWMQFQEFGDILHKKFLEQATTNSSSAT